MKVPRFTEDQFMLLQETYGSDSSIAKQYHVTRHTISKIRKDLGIKSSRYKSKLTARDEWIVEQFENKVAVQDIAESRNLSTFHVYKIIAKRRKK